MKENDHPPLATPNGIQGRNRRVQWFETVGNRAGSSERRHVLRLRIYPPAPDLRPLEPKTAKGRRVLIPRTMWPDYACTEQGGTGWAARIKSCSARDGIARVHFESAIDEEGRPYPDEHLMLSDLQPL